MPEVNVKKIVTRSVLGVVALIFLFGSWTIVKPGQRGIVIRLGSVSRTVSEGVHFKIPLLESVKKVDVRVQKSEVSAEAASRDLQNVTAIIAVNYQLDSQNVSILYQQVGLDFDTKLIAPALQEAVKSATAKYTAEELITKREQVKADIKQSLAGRMTNNHIAITEVNIVNFDFSPSFNKAIEAKVTAEQDALAAKNKLEQVKYEAEQRIAQSRGEAEAIKIQSQAVQQQGGAEYINLQWIKAWEKGGSQVPQVIAGGDASNFIMNLQSKK